MTINPTRRGFLLGAGMTAVTATLPGKAFAQNATMDAARNGDLLARQYVEGYIRLRDNDKLIISFEGASTQLRNSFISSGRTARDDQAEFNAKAKLDRAALPLVQSWLDDTPASQLSAEKINPAFDLLVDYLTKHSRNMTGFVTNARAAGLQDAALIFALADDMFEGGSLAGLALNAGTLLDKRNAVLDHLTGAEARTILRQSGIDIQLSGSYRRLKVDGKKRVITVPRDTLVQPKMQQLTAYALRDFATEVALSEKTPGAGSYLIIPIEGPYGNLKRRQRGVGYASDAIDFSIAHARDVMLPKIAEDLRKLPPLPEPVAAKPVARSALKKLNR